MTRTNAQVLAAICVVLAARSARAAPSSELRVAVLPIAVKGALPPRGEKLLGDAVVAGFSGEFEVIPPADVLRSDRNAKGCKHAPCAQSVAEKTGATHVVRSSVVRQRDDYKFEVVLLDGITGEEIGSAADTCDLCGLAEAKDMISKLTDATRRKLAANIVPPTLVVTSTPSGALVTVGDEDLGVTPLDLPVRAGAQEVTVSKDGFLSQHRDVEFVGGVREALAFSLDAIPDDGAAKQKRLFRILGGTGLGLGIAGMSTGITLIAIHHRPVLSQCSGTSMDMDGDCRLQHETLPGGIISTVLGVGGVVAGVVLLVKARGSTNSTARIRPARGGLALTF